MIPLRLLASISLASCIALATASCSTTQNNEGSLKTAYVPAMNRPAELKATDPLPMEPAAWGKPNNPSGLAGRTLNVGSVSDIRLGPKEVVLTFDDGPMPGKTETILATLDRYGVKATFLMVGQMAKAHPALARKVAARGHSIGSHTWRHANLAGLGYDQAMTEILKGEDAVEKGSGTDAGFFRFPYLASTPKLRAALARRGTVVLDVSVDSKDYFKSAPETVVARTMGILRHRHGGVILMHDIHGRTAAALPGLLAQLKAEGYKVVNLRYKRSRMDMIASLN